MIARCNTLYRTVWDEELHCGESKWVYIDKSAARKVEGCIADTRAWLLVASLVEARMGVTRPSTYTAGSTCNVTC